VLGLPPLRAQAPAWLCTAASAAPGAPWTAATSLLRGDFALPSGVISNATLFLTGLGQFQARLNGAPLSADANAPGWTAWGKRLLYSAYAIAPAQLAGGGSANTLAFVLGNGMYNVPPPIGGRYTKWTGTAGPRMVFAQLEVGFGDGTVHTVSVDGSAGFLGTDGGAVAFAHQYAGEDYNGSLATPGWDAPGFDPVASNPAVPWAPAVDCTARAPTGALRLSAFEAITVVETLPLAISPPQPTPSSPGTILLDWGKNFAGYANVTLSGVPAGATVRVTPSETLFNGDIAQCSGGCPMWWSHTSPLGGSVTLAPAFSWTGFRWATVQVLPPPQAAQQAQPAPAPAAGGGNGTLLIHSATYGACCTGSAAAGDATAAVAAFCGAGAAACTYQVCVCGDNRCGAGAPPCLPDPASNCAKDFSVAYGCSGVPGSNFSAYLPPEADNGAVHLSCPPPPPPPLPLIPVVTAATGHFMRAGVATVGTWKCSDDWVNRIHAITVEAIAANLHSVLTDCPHRERLGWLEVSHLMFPSISLNFDISRLWAKISLDTVDSQLPSGLVPDIAPEYTVFSGGFRDSPEWGSASVLNPFWLALNYGDIATLNATWGTASAYVEYLLSRREPGTGLLNYGLGDWIPVTHSPVAVTATGILVQDLQALAVGAARLGLAPALAARYTALAANVSAAFHAAFWSPRAGAYATQCAAGMALVLGIAEAQGCAAAARAALLADVRAQGNVSTSGEIGNRYALLALGAMGAEGVAAVWDSLQRRSAPGYGWMLTRGETTLSESWTDSPSDSHLHAMYGHVDEFLYTYIAGVRGVGGEASGTLWDRVEVAPVLVEGLQWVECSVESPRGLVAVRYERVAGGGVVVAASVPPGVEGVLVLPVSGRRVVLQGGEELRVREEAA
jgi:hypothetical protein